MNTCYCKKCDKTFLPDGITGADSTCPYCGEVFDKALFSLDIYRPQKEYLCPKCHSAIQANFEQKKIDLKSLAK